MKHLLLLRHAKSSWKDEALDDHDRPLNKRGRRAAPKMGRLMEENDIVPDWVVASFAVRARDTACRAMDAAGYRGDTLLTDALYLASPEEILDVVAGAPDVDRVLVVAHNPGMEELYWQLSGRDEAFVTAALAVFRFDIDAWSEVHDAEAVCEGFWIPRSLPDTD